MQQATLLGLIPADDMSARLRATHTQLLRNRWAVIPPYLKILKEENFYIPPPPPPPQEEFFLNFEEMEAIQVKSSSFVSPFFKGTLSGLPFESIKPLRAQNGKEGQKKEGRLTVNALQGDGACFDYGHLVEKMIFSKKIIFYLLDGKTVVDSTRYGVGLYIFAPEDAEVARLFGRGFYKVSDLRHVCRGAFKSFRHEGEWRARCLQYLAT